MVQVWSCESSAQWLQAARHPQALRARTSRRFKTLAPKSLPVLLAGWWSCVVGQGSCRASCCHLLQLQSLSLVPGALGSLQLGVYARRSCRTCNAPSAWRWHQFHRLFPWIWLVFHLEMWDQKNWGLWDSVLFPSKALFLFWHPLPISHWSECKVTPRDREGWVGAAPVQQGHEAPRPS